MTDHRSYGIGVIRFWAHTNPKLFNVSIKSDLTKLVAGDNVIVTEDEYGVYIDRAGMDYRGKTKTIIALPSGWVQVTYISEIAIAGRYYIDSDSTEDQLVVYFDQNINPVEKEPVRIR